MHIEVPQPAPLPTLVGRSSSHFTRVARIFAAELAIAHRLDVLRDLGATDAARYAGNPALRIPVLETAQGTWFGAQNISRELWRRSTARPFVVWPEQLDAPLLANAHELVLNAMATEVTLITARAGGVADDAPFLAKAQRSLRGCMHWLDAHAPEVLAALPPTRALSFLEVSLYCLVTHLEFRGVLETAPYASLGEFCRRFGARASAEQTAFCFDP